MTNGNDNSGVMKIGVREYLDDKFKKLGDLDDRVQCLDRKMMETRNDLAHIKETVEKIDLRMSGDFFVSATVCKDKVSAVHKRINEANTTGERRIEKLEKAQQETFWRFNGPTDLARFLAAVVVIGGAIWYLFIPHLLKLLQQ